MGVEVAVGLGVAVGSRVLVAVGGGEGEGVKVGMTTASAVACSGSVKREGVSTATAVLWGDCVPGAGLGDGVGGVSAPQAVNTPQTVKLMVIDNIRSIAIQNDFINDFITIPWDNYMHSGKSVKTATLCGSVQDFRKDL